MRPFEIRNAIAAGLESPASEYWAGMCEQDRNDVVSEVQRGETTIDEAIDTIQTWCAEQVPDDEDDS